jgi:hypothetical protein
MLQEVENMKTLNIGSLLMMLAAAFSAQAAAAQVLPGSSSYFPMIGITLGQTLQINLVAFPPSPCFAQMGFVDGKGNIVGQTSNVTLQPGQSASLSIRGNSLVNTLGQRVELMPQVLVNPNSASACQATAEVFGDLLGATTVLAPGAQGYPPDPIFGVLHVTAFQTVRLNIAAYPPDPCDATISFVDGNGVLVGNALKNVQLASGQATYLDLQGLTLVSGLGQRATLRPVVTANNAAAAGPPVNVCAVSAEIYDNFDGATDVYFPPDPCDPATGSCAAP